MMGMVTNTLDNVKAMTNFVWYKNELNLIRSN